MRIKPVVLTVGVSPMMAARLRRTARTHDEFTLHEARTSEDAVTALRMILPSVVMISTELEQGGALALSDYIAFRYPSARVIFEMQETTGFADGSLFAHATNAHAMVTPGMRADDITAVVAHHAVPALSA